MSAHVFTFHNVSINTNIEILTFCRHVHLHSTMFLLIRTPKGCFACPFHNLHSTMFLLIQTNQHYSERSKKNLHSTMFLLIPYTASNPLYKSVGFTFHNVSINTISEHNHLQTPLCIYIPQCFY